MFVSAYLALAVVLLQHSNMPLSFLNYLNFYIFGVIKQYCLCILKLRKAVSICMSSYYQVASCFYFVGEKILRKNVSSGCRIMKKLIKDMDLRHTKSPGKKLAGLSTCIQLGPLFVLESAQ